MTSPIFDTHAHYSSRAFDADRFALLDSLPEKGVVGVCEQATHSGDAPAYWNWLTAIRGCMPPSASIPRACWPPRTAARKALPPTVSVFGGDWAAEMKALAPCYDDPKVVAVGECGLDYHWPVPKAHSWRCLRRRSALRLSWTSPSSSTTETPTPTSTPC